jgi:YVTN family beta-propeller protein
MYFCKSKPSSGFSLYQMKNIPFIFYFLLLFLSSCDDMHDVPTPINLPATPGETGQLFVLSEGLFNMNNSTLSFVNFGKQTIEYDFFSLLNNRGLGDTANDMKKYGAKMWIIVTVSSQVEVVDIKTGISIKRIPFFDENGKARQPRFVTFKGNKAYVCSFDGTVERIDTASLKIDAITTCGRNPDGIAVANGKLYVSNSGGLDFNNYDNTVSVVNLTTFTEVKKITVGVNPFKIETDSQGDLYVVSRGNNGSIKASWARINSQTDEVVQTFEKLPVINFTIHNDTAYLYNYDFENSSYWIKTFDCKTELLISQNFITDSTRLERPFGIAFHPTNGNVYLTDARSYTIKGNLLCFNRKGKLLYKIESVGLNPNTVVVVP